MNLSTIDNRVSPAVDLDNASVLFINNRINSAVTNYATDFRVNTFENDPSRFIYVTKNIALENPATSLQVLLDAYIHESSDIRVFFALDQDVPLTDTIFVPFPGYNNLDPNGDVISTTNSDGSSDLFVKPMDAPWYDVPLEFFREYKFTANKLNPYSTFRIKIVGTSTNMSVVPQIKNLRVISFA